MIVTTQSNSQMQEMSPVRGYQSSVDYVLNFGLGKENKVKEIRVIWNGDSVSVVNNPAINTTINISEAQSVTANKAVLQQPALLQDVTKNSGIDFIQRENEFVDFKREFLIPYELSRQGPKMSKGDVNEDGLEDVYIGGPAEQSGALYVQTAEGRFKRSDPQPWLADAIHDDVGSVFFDADNDDDLDLYVVSGGNEWSVASPGLQDRLYLNDGKGKFSKNKTALPKEMYSGSCVTAADFDKDGDIDLFIGARVTPGNYPFSEGNMILRNDFNRLDKRVHFTDISKEVAGENFSNAGMVTDASWTDIDKDGWADLVIVGDWMPVKIFRNENGKRLVDITAKSGLDVSNGWWCRIMPADIDKDGDVDFIVANMGTNSQFKVNEQQPLVTYADDFNNDGRIGPIMTWYIQGTSYPFNSRDELVEQMPQLNKKFLKYADFASAAINDIVGKEQAERAKKFYIYHTETSLLINNNGKFQLKALPIEAQFSMMNGILYKDFDRDGKEDILLSGNFYPFRVQQGKCDAGIGSLLKGDGKGGFVPVNRATTGLYIPGDVRDMIEVKGFQKNVIVVSENNDHVQVIAAN